MKKSQHLISILLFIVSSTYAQDKAMIEDKPSLIAVGAAHLTGENGLINLLLLEGYNVDPVKG